ncbi:glycosyltransferase [Odoribacter lunatus]|uniref:glycosyltransferase n=1 Tax=Odoribacter lunatus TaxID=2941335 RepID=UPI00203CB112|nr:glycosyltransferase [Odoribacter lunatus]
MEDCNKIQTVVFLIFQEIHPDEGISKKILAQVKAIEKLGYRCQLGRFVMDGEGESHYYIGNSKIYTYGSGIICKFRKIYCYSAIANYLISKKNVIKCVYIRYTQFSNIFSAYFFKRLYDSSINILLEIPTYPYDGEFCYTSLKSYRIIEERITRKKFMSYVNKIVTFSNNDYIFGKRTFIINNAIDLETIPLRKIESSMNEINLIGVADLSFWHGYDRIIYGIKNYLQEGENDLVIKFHIVGSYPGGEEYEKLKRLAKSLKVEDYVICYGTKSGEYLNKLFNKANLAIGCLGCHRKGILEVQSLKNVEYAARGIPFIYSEINNHFDNQIYVLKEVPDDSPIDIKELIRFIQNVKISPQEIRDTIRDFTWENQMGKIFSLYNS